MTNKTTESGVILSERERVEESILPRLCIKDIGCEDPSTTHLRCFAQDDTEIRYLVRSMLNSNLAYFNSVQKKLKKPQKFVWYCSCHLCSAVL